MYELLNVFTNKAGNYHLLYELKNKHHRHVTWLPIFLILIDRTVFLTQYYLLKLTTFKNVKCLIECTILNKINLLLYLSVFRENLDDIGFHVEHSVQLLNWIHFRIESLYMDILNKKDVPANTNSHQLCIFLVLICPLCKEISIVHRIQHYFLNIKPTNIFCNLKRITRNANQCIKNTLL